ncbi:hypothetical protein AX769_06260 [Frondihabitans sp. PAMC 28766]|uniref:hypothetical protein n=1 Tax=Frondihabitans sp. PAMC 28766 TaxID=1795630 RepID=UPI00078E4857|nr:hypothetical protein [Frondihabitans sp. PAMC 28766]AMM19830.1 hypothetical protein AX769_06260 [Frondihabitans sp. PAMC 28766]
MEPINLLSDDEFDELEPERVSPVLWRFTQHLSEGWDRAQDRDAMARLMEYLPRMAGTLGDGHEDLRPYLATDWLVRTFLPRWLDLAGETALARQLADLAPLVDESSTEDAAELTDAVLWKSVELRDARGLGAMWERTPGEKAREKYARGVGAELAMTTAASDAVQVAATGDPWQEGVMQEEQASPRASCEITWRARCGTPRPTSAGSSAGMPRRAPAAPRPRPSSTRA